MPDVYSIRMVEDPCLPGASVHQYPVGVSLDWAMDDLARALGMDLDLVEVFNGETHVPREAWADTRPEAGAALALRAVPGISGAIALFASFAGQWVAGLSFLGGGLLAQAVGLAVTFAVQAAASSLLRPETPSIGADRGPDRYSISGSRNRLIQWDAVPIVMGRMRFAPPYGAAPYTEVRGEDQYLRLLFVWGRGPVRLSDLRIGNTSLDSFEGVEIEHDLDGTGTLSLFPRDADQQSLNVKINDDWSTRETAEDTDEFGVTVTFPNGIYEVTDEGRSNTNFELLGEYRAVGSPTWIPFWEVRENREAASTVRYATNVKPPVPGQFEIRLRVNDLEADDNEHIIDAFWTALRSFRNEAPVNAPGIAKTALVIKANDELSGVIDEFNAIVERAVPTWNGSNWNSSGYTSNPAALFRDVLTSPSNARPVTSANTADDNLGEWFEHCTALGLTYENVLQGQNSVAAVLTAIATAGFASPTMYDDRFGVVIDKARDTVVQAITPRNSWNFSGQINAPEELHALRVQFRNREKDYADDEVIVYAQGYSAANATRFEVVNPDGISIVEQAQLFGRFLLLSRILRAAPYQVSMDFEHLLARRGDLVAFSHDAALIGDTAGRIKDVDGVTLTVDEPVTFDAGGSYNVRVRTRDGVMLLLTATGTGTTDKITVSDATNINAGDLFLFGPVDGEAQLCLISDIERGEDMQAEIALLPYVPELYDAIDEGAFESDLSEPVGLGLVGPAQPRILQVLTREQSLPQSAQGDVLPTIIVSFEPGFAPAGNWRVTQARNALVSWRLTGTDSWQTMTVSALAGEARITGVQRGAQYDIRVIAQDAEFRTSQPAFVLAHQIGGLLSLPPTVQGFAVEPFIVLDSAGGQRRPGLRLTWTPPPSRIRQMTWQVRVQATGQVVQQGGRAEAQEGATIVSGNIVPGETYEVRMSHVAPGPVDLVWTAWLAVTAPDVRLSAEDLADELRAEIEEALTRHDAELEEAEGVVAELRDSAIAAYGDYRL
ncbi:host specificity factor TipJ family phage tail protein, partial [Roseivivax isoporae]